MTIYKVNNIFYSIEGEGLWTGYPTIFIRMSQCNLRCDYCDEDFSAFTKMTTKEIIDKIKQYPAKRIRITGGEPMLQDLSELLKELYFKCKYVAIETNGTIYNDDAFTSVDLISADIKGPSSGEESDYKVIQKLYHRFKAKTEFKFVISNLNDLEFYKNYRKEIEGANIVLMCNSNINHKAKIEIIDGILRSCPEARYCIRLQCVLGLK
jgi:7-carboxy-7-deazaguanine synthase